MILSYPVSSPTNFPFKTSFPISCMCTFILLFNFSLPGTDYKRAVYFHITGRQDKEVCIQLRVLEKHCIRFCPVCFKGEMTEATNYEKQGGKSPTARTIIRKIPKVLQTKLIDDSACLRKLLLLVRETQLTNT